MSSTSRCGLAFNFSRRVKTAVEGYKKQTNKKTTSGFIQPPPQSFFKAFCIFKPVEADCRECRSVVMCERLNKLLCGVMTVYVVSVYVCDN